MSKEKDKVLDHDYDGIKECDNLLPRWWLNIFYATIVFSIVYMGYYHFGGNGKSQVELLQAQLAEESLQQQMHSHDHNAPSGFEEKDFKGILGDQKKTVSAKALYNERCVSCHGVGGAGGIGPNLTDNYWLHGGKPHTIARSISEGVPDKGMIPWKSILSRDEVISLAAYILSIKGTAPPNPKGPQGVKEVP